MYLKDKDADIILDSIITDNFAKYSFVGKSNREYEFTTLNGDSLYEQFSIQTIPNQTNHHTIFVHPPLNLRYQFLKTPEP